jgi:putative ATPase
MATPTTPLAEQLRPSSLDEIVGQDHLLGKDGFITFIIKSGKPLSILLWGPPGCGKTSIARLYAKAFLMRFVSVSAIFTGIADLKKIIQESEEKPLLGPSTLLFVDEIHRFNKAQQDAFLPFLEKGQIILVGATAENPSFYLNNALLSRLRVLKLNALNENDLEQLLQHFEREVNPLNITVEIRQLLIRLSQGDGRYLFNLVENLQSLPKGSELDLESLKNFLQKRAPLFDRGDDQHYNIISALHKSVRGSDPDASLYWFSRMLEGGEEPLFIARRLIRMASEDIGLADPQALPLAIAARDAYEMLGSPEGELALAEVVVYLALAPKSNAIYTAFGAARELAAQTSHLDPPAIILNAPTKLMKNMGYGKGYQYDHDTPQGFSGQNYFPDGIERKQFYFPVERGFEREMIKRLDYFNKLRKQNLC